jgi:stress-induced morphogen
VLKFNEYDELVTRAEAIQMDLTHLLMSPRNLIYEDNQEEEILVKSEDDGDDDDITFEPIYFEEGEEIDPSLLNDDYQIEEVVVDTNENFAESSQATSKKALKAALNSSVKETAKQENRNYLMVELDNNQRVFQCDVCSKCFKDKSKLKTHREIHTTERNVICKVC